VYFEAGAQQRLRDAHPHRAEANDPDAVNLFCHLCAPASEDKDRRAQLPLPAPRGWGRI
jgi:hypothetical protein